MASLFFFRGLVTQHPPCLYPLPLCFPSLRYWDAISVDAKDVISQMLTVDPKKRPSARSLLDHAWFAGLEDGGGDAAGREKKKPAPHLAQNQKELKKHLARRRFKAAGKAMLAIRRMGTLMGGTAAVGGAAAGEAAAKARAAAR